MTMKTFAIAAVATIALATTASADAFSFNKGFEGQTVELGQVTSAGNGVVTLYDFHGGEQGALLGEQMVSAGANYDVRVTLDQPAVRDVLAVLTVDGQIVDTKELRSLN